MALDWGNAVTAVATVAVAALAAWLLWLDPRSRVVRAFALILALRAVQTGLNVAARAVDDAAFVSAVPGMRAYADIALPLAVVSFLVVFTLPRTDRRGSVVRWTILGVVVVAEALYAADHCLDLCPGPDGRLAFGPLAVLAYPLPVAFGAVGLVMAVQAARSPAGPRRRGLLLGAMAFTLTALLDSGLRSIVVVTDGYATLLVGVVPSAWATAANVLFMAGLVPAAAAYVVIGRALGLAHGLEWSAWTLSVLGLSIVAIDLGPPTPALALLGAWRLVLPVVVAYAIVRYRLFGLDARVQGSLGHGAVAAAVVVAFFVVSETVEAAFSGWSGSALVGVAASVAMLLVTHPLERAGHRLARVLFDTEAPVDVMTPDQRAALFTEQAQIAWSDGVLTQRERLLLDRLRERLGLAPHEASRIEDAAVPVARRDRP